MIKLICGGIAVEAKPQYKKFSMRRLMHRLRPNEVRYLKLYNIFEQLYVNTEKEAIDRLLDLMRCSSIYLIINRSKLFRTHDVYLQVLIVTDLEVRLNTYQLHRNESYTLIDVDVIDLMKMKPKVIYIGQPNVIRYSRMRINSLCNDRVRLFVDPNHALTYMKMHTRHSPTTVNILGMVHTQHQGGPKYSFNQWTADSDYTSSVIITDDYDRNYYVKPISRGLIPQETLDQKLDFRLCAVGYGARWYDHNMKIIGGCIGWNIYKEVLINDREAYDLFMKMPYPAYFDYSEYMLHKRMNKNK